MDTCELQGDGREPPEGYGIIYKNNPISIKELDDSNSKGIFVSDMFTFKLFSDDDSKEYLISIGKHSQYVEIYDFYTNNIYFEEITNVFNVRNPFTIIGTHIKLSSSQNKNSYLIGILGCEYPDEVEKPYFYIKKVNFTSLDIKNTPPLYETVNIESSYSKIVSCYETINKYIICFYQKPTYEYTMIVYNYYLVKKKSLDIVTGHSNEEFFFKCIHFFDETGVFAYFSNQEKPLIRFEFKSYLYSFNSIIDTYSNFDYITIHDYYFNTEKVTFCDIIKIEDKRFIFVGILEDKSKLSIISTINYYLQNFIMRIYNLNIKDLYNFDLSGILKLSMYKNFLAIGANFYYNIDSSIGSFLIIFSYPNTTESSIELSNYLYFNNDTKINNFTIELKGEYKIENNIFGYVFSGIQIIENCFDLDNIYLAELNDKKINKSYFLPEKEKIKIIIPKQNNYFPFICQFKYACVVTEPEYSEFNKYPNEVYDTSQANIEYGYFLTHKKNYIGRYSYFNLSLNFELTEINCIKKCELCYSNDTNMCITCQNKFYFDENSKKICLSENENEKNFSCSLNEIIQNQCIDEINNEQLREVYLYIRSKLINSNETLIKTKNVIFQVTEIEDQTNSDDDISNVELGQCKIRLKKENNISESEDLIIFKIDIKNIEKSTTYVQYEIYNPETYQQLKLDICSDLNIYIYSPVNLDDETLSLYSSLNILGYNLFNQSDLFYNDFCTPYTTSNGSDILLSDRKTEIYENYGNQALCQSNCEILEYNYTAKKVKCYCDVQAEETILDTYTNNQFESSGLTGSFLKALSNSNFQVLKCYKLAFDTKNIFQNIGRIIYKIY